MRLFVAVWPDPAVRRGLVALERPAVTGVRWTPEADWHVTLRFLGEMDDPAPLVSAVGAAAAAVAGVSSSERPGSAVARAVVDPRPAVLGRSALVLPVGGLGGLAAAVAAATAGLGRSADRRPFRGHLTVARSAGAVPAASRRWSISGWSGPAGTLSWAVRELTVVSSTPGGPGSPYEVVARTSLARGDTGTIL